MNRFEDKLWEHLVEHHAADRARLRPVTRSPPRVRTMLLATGVAGVAVLGVALALVLGSTPRVGRAGNRAHPGPIRSGPVTTDDTAYIVTRIRASVAAYAGEGLVLHTLQYSSGRETSDGAFVGLGKLVWDSYAYLAPNGWTYERGTSDGSPSAPVDATEQGPVVRGSRYYGYTSINPVDHTFWQEHTGHVSSASVRPHSILPYGGPAGVRRAIRLGHLIRVGMPVIDGTPAIAFSIGLTRRESPEILYVDARTDAPLREAAVIENMPGGLSGTYICDWVVATPQNIALAMPSIPAGYMQVSVPASQRLRPAHHRGR